MKAAEPPKVLYSKALSGSLPSAPPAVAGPPLPGPPSSGSIPAPPPGLTSSVLSSSPGNAASNLVGPNLYHTSGGNGRPGGDRRDHYGNGPNNGRNSGANNSNMSGLNSGNNMRGGMGNNNGNGKSGSGGQSPYPNRHNQPYQNSRMPSNNNNSTTSSASPPIGTGGGSSVGNGPNVNSNNNNNANTNSTSTTTASTNGSTSSGPVVGGPNNGVNSTSGANATPISASGANNASSVVTTNGNGSVTPEGKSSLLSDYTDRSSDHHHRRFSDRNAISKTNLYIRGLTPNTTDKDLHSLCSPYGVIISTKAILDKDTNKCRGYGFVDFEQPISAENAVKSLVNQGVQAQMAKCSDANRGKDSGSISKGGPALNEHDPTNLYIANLPLSMTESDLEAMLSMYGSVISTRILKDSNGTPRGVGFARMETKEKCDAIINLLNGKMLPGSKDTLLVKFADGGNKKKHYKNSEHRYRNDDLQMSFDSTNLATNGVPTQLLPSPLGAASAYQRAAAFSAATGTPYQNALQANPWLHHQGPPQYIMQPQMIPSNMDPNAAAALQYSPLMHQLTAQMSHLQLSGGAGYMPGTHAYGTQAIYPQQLIQSMPLPGEQETINPSHSVSSGSASGEEQQQQQQQQQQQHTFQQMCYTQQQK